MRGGYLQLSDATQIDVLTREPQVVGVLHGQPALRRASGRLLRGLTAARKQERGQERAQLHLSGPTALTVAARVHRPEVNLTP